MKPIFSKKEKALYYLIIVVFIVILFCVFTWAKNNERIVGLDEIAIANIDAYIFVIFLYLLQWGKYKVAQLKILKLNNEWRVIDAFSKEKIKRMVLFFLVLNLAVLIGIKTINGRYILLIMAMLNRYFENILNKGYLDSKHFIVKYKMYALEGINTIKDEFGTNFTIYYDTESYQIFTASDAIKDAILKVCKEREIKFD